ncbi:MAG: hypothetical protein EBW32_13280 [Rhodobacteraceae bacterium]|nr:hypothetical protein [Paracoccaceae bacterium]
MHTALDTIWASLPIPAILVDEGDKIAEINPAAEGFFNTSNRAINAVPLFDRLMVDAPAHEIKNPLAGITGAAQLLSMGLDPKDLELTDLIVEETRRIVKLLEQVEQFGNLREPIRQPVNLHDILDRVRRSALLGFGAHMTISDEYDPSLPPALGDIDQLMQVIMNLVKNAAEASPQGGTIRLRTYYEHSFRLRRSDSVGQALPLQVEVWDDGPGLPDEIHGGWISVNSVPGRTVFRMSLPMATTQKGA